MCPRIIRFPDTMEQWSYKKAQMDLASIYWEKAFFTLFYWLKDGIRKQDLVNSIFSSAARELCDCTSHSHVTETQLPLAVFSVDLW